MTQRQLGLRENALQFGLLVLVNSFVGAMVGLERAILPLMATDLFGVESRVAILSFIASFGLAKALANLFAGAASDRFSRRRVLITGWLLGIPVPIMILMAPSWGWIVLANIFLGLNQGLAWSATVIMKIDLVGPRNRGLAMGLNEASGYVAVSIAAFASGYLASHYGLRPVPFYPGVAIVILGLLTSFFFVKDTTEFARLESQSRMTDDATRSFIDVFRLTSWTDKTLFSVSQAGLVNNLNDGLAWGLLPLLFVAYGHSVFEIGILASLYPAVWGLTQLGTGALSDRTGRKPMIVSGMILQGFAIFSLTTTNNFAGHAFAMTALGLGTAAVYPTLLSAVGDVAHPAWRATAVGVYRLWRDGGYVVGAFFAGIIAQIFDMSTAIRAVAALTVASGILAAVVMKETVPKTP